MFENEKDYGIIATIERITRKNTNLMYFILK